MHDDDLDALMQEPPGGGNFGRRASSSLPSSEGDTGSDRWQPLSVARMQTEEFMRTNGWTVVDPTLHASRAGITSHRGVNAPTEHIDVDLVRGLVEQELGFTFDEIQAAYKNGRPTTFRAGIRAAIDARLLALSRSGGNMTALARVLGWEIDANRVAGKMTQALARARAAEAAA